MIINCQNEISKVKEAFSQVFRKKDPFDRMFVPLITNKVLLYPTNGYHLSEKQFLALIRTLKMFGETSFYLSEIEGDDAFEQKVACALHPHAHFKLSLETSYAEYLSTNIIFENALYSSKGNWGIIISHEEHAVLGGHKSFVETFKSFYPDYKENQKYFIQAIEYWGKPSKADLSWLPAFIEYINEQDDK